MGTEILLNLEWMLGAVVGCYTTTGEDVCTDSVQEIVGESGTVHHVCIGRLVRIIKITILFIPSSSSPVIFSTAIIFLTIIIIDTSLGGSRHGGGGRVQKIIH